MCVYVRECLSSCLAVFVATRFTLLPITARQAQHAGIVFFLVVIVVVVLSFGAGGLSVVSKRRAAAVG